MNIDEGSFRTGYHAGYSDAMGGNAECPEVHILASGRTVDAANLLEALEQCVYVLEHLDYHLLSYGEGIMSNARQAIAEAKGEI